MEEFFRSLGEGWGYVVLFLSSLGENLFPPLPGDTFVVLGAFLVGRGELKLLPAYVATTAGSISGFMVLYFVGFRWGRKIFTGGGGRFFSEGNLLRAEQWFDRYGYLVLAMNRFLSGFRGVVSLAAGVVRMNVGVVFGLGLLSCLIWNGILMGVGIWVGENWAVIVRHYQLAVGVLIVLFLVFWWIKNLWRRRGVG